MDRPAPSLDSLRRMTLAELLERFPQAKAVLHTHFGASCFECPAVSEETVELGARVHRVEEEFYRDLLEAIIKA